jgi:hypothetical protein
MSGPIAWMVRNADGAMSLFDDEDDAHRHADWAHGPRPVHPLYAVPSEPSALTPRELELIEGMIEVQLHHARQCDSIANRAMAEKQKGWDMERVALLRKLKGST